jgi:hypothetical protein
MAKEACYVEQRQVLLGACVCVKRDLFVWKKYLLIRQKSPINMSTPEALVVGNVPVQKRPKKRPIHTAKEPY